MKLESNSAKEDHEKFRRALVDALKGFEDLDPQDLLACAAQFCGLLMAMQDQMMTPEMAIELVLKNMELGNNSAVMHGVQTAGNA